MESVGIRHLDAKQRAGVYVFLAKVLGAPPTRDTVWALSQMAAALKVHHSEGPELGELEQVYEELFIVPNARYVAPYESVFRHSSPTHWTPGSQHPVEEHRQTSPAAKTVQEVQECYQSAGLALNENGPDHIGNELRFMAYLWWREADASPAEARKLAAMRVRFRQKHLMKWIGDLTQKIAESDRSGYYCTASRVTETVIQEDV